MGIYYPTTSDFVQKTLGAELLTANTTVATFNNATSIQNLAGVFIVDRVDANGVATPTKAEVISFEAVSGATVTTLVRGLGDTSAQDHAVGAIVEFGPTATWAQGLIDTFVVQHGTDGTHTNTIVALLAGAQTFTGAKTFTTGLLKAVDVTSGSGVSTFPTSTDTLVGRATTDTLTNKRITQRVVTTTDDATAVIDCAVTDQYQLSAVANATEFTVTGTPTDGQKLIIRYKDAGVSKNLTFTGFTALGVTIPTATTAGKWGYVGAVYNSAATTWHVLAVSTEA